MTTAATVLTKAADLIETQGWTQGAYYRKGCFCADGALQVSSGYAVVDPLINDLNYADEVESVECDLYSEAYRAACKAVGKTAYGMANIIGFNDEKSTTAADVIAVLRQAAEDVAA